MPGTNDNYQEEDLEENQEEGQEEEGQDGTGSGNESQGREESVKLETPEQFEAWIKGQGEPVAKALTSYVEKQTTGIKKALDNERGVRSKLEKQVKTLTKDLEEGSEARKQAEKLQADLAEYQVQLTFYRESLDHNVNNPDLGYIAAQKAGLIDEDGKIDWDSFKSRFPQLITVPTQAEPAKKPPVRGGAGAGANQAPKGPKNMTDWIRAAAQAKTRVGD